MDIQKYISERLQQADSLPFFFAGSGVSRRYLNLPDWQGLLDYIATLVYEDQFGYAQVKQAIQDDYSKEKNYNLYMTKLCDAIAIDLNKIWYTHDRFMLSRTEYEYEVIKQQVPPIKIEIAKYVKSFENVKFSEEYLDEINSLREITSHSIAGVITTNYDNFLEQIFEFSTYSSQEELLFRTNYEVGEIYKIHGSTEFPGSIKINTKDYEDIEAKNKYLAAKLLTIFVEHPIFFIGYSLNDEDVKQILENIIMCLNTKQIAELQNRMFYIEWDNSLEKPQIGTHSIAFQNNVTLSMPKISCSNYTELYNSIGSHKSPLPVKALRKLKHQMYDLALTTEGNSKIQVQSVDRIINNDDDFEIIAGFGIFDLARRGYKSITSEEIFSDLLFSDGSFNNHYLVFETLPKLLPSSSYSLPFYKYIVGIEESELPAQIQKTIKRNYSELVPKSWNWDDKKSNNSMEETLSIPQHPKRFRELAMLKEGNMDVDLLEAHLKQHILDNPDALQSRYKSDLKRLIKILDWLKYK